MQLVADSFGGLSGSGFVLHDETGKPCVTFGYLTQKDAGPTWSSGRERRSTNTVKFLKEFAF